MWWVVGTLDNIPIPPTVNNSYINAGKGRIIAPALRDFKLDFEKWAIFSAKDIREIEKTIPHDKPLALAFAYHLHTSKLYTKKGTIKRYDVSNRIKAVEDAVMGRLGVDDSSVWVINASKCKVDHKASERVAVAIWAWTGESEPEPLKF